MSIQVTLQITSCIQGKHSLLSNGFEQRGSLDTKLKTFLKNSHHFCVPAAFHKDWTTENREVPL